MILGIHASIRDGYGSALRVADALGLGVLQIFCYRRHHEPSDQELETFRQGCAARDLRLLVHARYLPYLAADEGKKRRATIELLRRELRLSAALGAEGLIVHVGAFSENGDARRGLGLFCEALREAWEGSERRVPILVENVPGGGRRLGGSFEDLASVLADSPAAGVCLDTAHAYAFGYDLAREPRAFVDEARAKLDGRILALHLNDTQAPHGSNRENHCDWGEGSLAPAVEALFEGFDGLPAIVEVPRGGELKSLAFLRARLPR